MTLTNTIQIPYMDLITPPETEPLTLSEVKTALKIDGNDEDDFLIKLIRGAREAAERYLRRSIITQTWQLQFDQYVPTVVNLPRGPVQSVVSVKIIDHEWNETVINPDNYRLNAGKECLVLEAIPFGMVIQIRYVAGYGDIDHIPAQLKMGMIQHINAMYEDRTGSEDLPQMVRNLYAPFCIMKI